jgi:DNA modification methylase
MSAEGWPEVLQGDCREVLKTLPDESAHCCITSPPYWGLRDYGCEGQIGLEPTPEAHIEALLEVFAEVWRVMRPDATLWLNYGDLYAGSWGNQGREEERGTQRPINGPMLQNLKVGYPSNGSNTGKCPPGLKPKDLVGMPWRVAFALQAAGWWLRSDIIWSKGNPMPESVTDRPTRAHEYVFLLTKSERYFYDADAIREPLCEGTLARPSRMNGQKPPPKARYGGHDIDGRPLNPAGRNKRTVWEINSQPTPEAHFATFPEKLVEPCILAGTSERGCCPVCGAGWVRCVEKERTPTRPGLVSATDGTKEHFQAKGSGGNTELRYRNITTTETTGWRSTCTHPHTEAETVPAVVLDPFGGSGTVGKVATRLGRRSILIDLNPDYLKIAAKRTAQGGLGL